MVVFLQGIPPLIIAACALLVLLFFIFLARMFQETWRVLRDVAEFTGILRRLLRTGPANWREGLQLAQIENLRGTLKTRRSLLSSNVPRLWTDLESSLQPYSATDRPEGWFAIHPLREILSESAVIDRGYHTTFHQSVPSILTSVGLMATFIAILLALQGVIVQVKGGTEIVSGIGPLINGLAGKFLSSIVALFLALSFTLLEKKVCERRLQKAHDALLQQATEVIPVLSPTRVLLDMQALSARRTVLLERFYAEMAERVVTLIKTEIMPAAAGSFAREISDQVEERLAPVLEAVADRAGELEQICRQMASIEPAGSRILNGTDAAGNQPDEQWQPEEIA